MLGLGVGLTSEEMASMGDPGGCASFDATDRLVLRYAEELTRRNRVDDGLYAELASVFDRQQLFELCMAVGVSALVNRVHATFMTDVDERTETAVGHLAVCAIRRPAED
jgi:alkylhydroperoxidase family enzyme